MQVCITTPQVTQCRVTDGDTQPQQDCRGLTGKLDCTCETAVSSQYMTELFHPFPPPPLLFIQLTIKTCRLCWRLLSSYWSASHSCNICATQDDLSVQVRILLEVAICWGEPIRSLTLNKGFESVCLCLEKHTFFSEGAFVSCVSFLPPSHLRMNTNH